MRRFLLAVVASSVVLAGVVAAPSAAAPCPLVTDPAFDDQVWPAESGTPREASSPRADLTSADVVSDARVVTAVIRVRGLGGVDPSSEPGVGYWLMFTIGETDFTMSAERSPESSRFMLVLRRGSFGEVLSYVDGSFNADRNEIRITAPASLFRPHVRVARGTTLRGVTAVSFREQGVARLPVPVMGRPYGYMNGFSADSTRPGKTYVVGSAACVRP